MLCLRRSKKKQKWVCPPFYNLMHIPPLSPHTMQHRHSDTSLKKRPCGLTESWCWTIKCPPKLTFPLRTMRKTSRSYKCQRGKKKKQSKKNLIIISSDEKWDDLLCWPRFLSFSHFSRPFMLRWNRNFFNQAQSVFRNVASMVILFYLYCGSQCSGGVV